MKINYTYVKATVMMFYLEYRSHFDESGQFFSERFRMSASLKKKKKNTHKRQRGRIICIKGIFIIENTLGRCEMTQPSWQNP